MYKRLRDDISPVSNLFNVKTCQQLAISIVCLNHLTLSLSKHRHFRNTANPCFLFWPPENQPKPTCAYANGRSVSLCADRTSGERCSHMLSVHVSL